MVSKVWLSKRRVYLPLRTDSLLKLHQQAEIAAEEFCCIGQWQMAKEFSKECKNLDKIKDMSYCRQEGKDKIIFVTEEDHAEPSKIALADFEDEAEYEGLIKANGEINWECPCLGGMATGVCGEQFRSAFSCFHSSQSEPKGSECIEQFRTMQECFSKYPEIYGEFESVDEDEKSDKELFNENDQRKMDEKKEQEKSEKKMASKDEEETGTKNSSTL